MSDRFIYRVLATILFVPSLLFAYAGGPDDGHAGDPPNRSTCVACHNSFQLNSGQGSLRLEGLPEAYAPGEAYRVGIQLADPNARRWGFELTAKLANNNRGGAISVVNNDQTQLSNPGGNAAQYIKHRSAGTFRGQANSAAWSFDWTAPDQDAGQITFYVAGNAANNNGANNGDRIYAASVAISAFQNHAPVIREPAEAESFAVEIEAGAELSIDFSGTDEDQDDLQWLIADRGGLPEQANLTDNGDGTASFTWSPTQDDAGEYSPVFRLEDAHGDADQIVLDISVIGDGGQAGFTFRLNGSWNLVSAPISPAETNIPRLWQELVDRGRLLMIKDQSGRFYIVANRFSNLPAWDFRQGYYVRLNAADTMRISGDAVAVDTPIPLRDGWSYVAYFPERNLSAPVAFANIAEDLLIAKDGAGRFYIPARGFTNMGNLSRGNGYQVRSTRARDLIWNVPEEYASSEQEHPRLFQSDPQFLEKPAATGSNMSLLLYSRAPFTERADLGVFDEAGVCVGAASVWGEGPWGIAVQGDDPVTPEVDGAIEGEQLTIRFHGGLATDLRAKMKVSFTVDGFEEIEIASAQPLALDLVNLYPNPFNSSLTIEYKLASAGKVELIVTDLAGRKVAGLSSGESKAGRYRRTWDAAGFESGVYLVRWEVAGGTLVRKALFVK